MTCYNCRNEPDFELNFIDINCTAPNFKYDFVADTRLRVFLKKS